jgi:hypothetical protein
MSNYDIQILVNGSRCKQHFHNGKTFIEAKHGSEYTIEIKNNTWRRILAVCSVDGLDILNGEPATEDGPGYVIGSYNSSKFDGFRVTNDKVAKFVFSTKNASYAASKEDGSEKNVGVIGVRLFEEQYKPVINISTYGLYGPGRYGYDNTAAPSIWDEQMYKKTTDNTNHTYDSCLNDTIACSCDDSPVRGMNMSFGSQLKSSNTPNFDMGTKWGEAKESRVVEVEFERGVLALTTNIYYASRQSLIDMGVPLGNEKQVSFPEPFANTKYAKPPKGWNG